MAVMTAYSSRGAYPARRRGGRRANKHRAAPLNTPRLGRLTRSTDRKGQVSGFQYDLLDRRTQAGHGATSTVSPVYQNSTSYTWDQANRLTRIDDSVGGTITRTYDDRFDTVKQESGPEGTVDTTYTANGLKSSVDPTGGSAITHTYDNANRLTGLSQAAGIGQAEPATVQTVGFSYDSADRRTQLTLPNGIQVISTWDNASQLTGMGGSLAATDLPADVPTTAYDADNRLTNWNGQALSYDDNGNLQSDGATTYTWNSRDQLVALAGATSASFAYDGLGRRKSKTVNGVSTAYLYDGMNPIQEQSGATIQANLLAGPGLDQWVARTQGGQTVSYLPDALGSTLALANASQAITTSYTYEPYGQTTTSGAATGNTFAYTGRENDGTGLYYYRARYYQPGLGRFVSEDPVGLRGG
jgi:RHS repeat-associated protein